MKVAQVVPLRRFTSQQSWFDYLVPDAMELQVGQLVAIPFLRRTVPGIVFGISGHSDIPRLKAIQGLFRNEPVMTSWQIQASQRLAVLGNVSIGHLLVGLLPTWPKHERTTSSSAPWSPPSSSARSTFPDQPTWWYGQRQDAWKWMAAWWWKKSPQPRTIIVPTIQDADDFLAYHHLSDHIPVISAALPPAKWRQIYENVRLGRVKHCIGTQRALLLPYPQPPSWLVDQEEHPHHQQTEQNPRLHTTQALASLGQSFVVTTPAPSLLWYQQHTPTPPVENVSSRRVLSLGPASGQAWINSDVSLLLEQATKDRPILCIVPRKTYARSLQCRACGHTVACQQCHQKIILPVKTSDRVLCRFCHVEQDLPVACPNCRASDWSWTGLGLGKFQKILDQAYPGRSVILENDSTPSASMYLGTYQSYQHIKSRHIHTVVVVHGDALLNIPDFSAGERAWQYLHRLTSLVSPAPVIVQSYAPDQNFWQWWQHGQHQRWYEEELISRRQLNLPPWTEQWIARYPGRDHRPMLATAQRQLQHFYPLIQVQELPSLTALTPGRPVGRLLLTGPEPEGLSQIIPTTEIFPYPWQIDRRVQSWLG